MAGEWSPQASDWWRASDGLWYPPEARPDGGLSSGEPESSATAARPEPDTLPDPDPATSLDPTDRLSSFDPPLSSRESQPFKPRMAPPPAPPAPVRPRPRPEATSATSPPPRLPQRKNLAMPIIAAISVMVIAFAVVLLAAS